MSRKKVFMSTWIGLIIPLLFTEMLGAAVMTATSINDGDNIYQAGYDASGTGGLLGAVLFPPLGNFGRFCLVMLALSIIANNCPNVYSVALTLQVISKWTARVPRFLWTTLATGAYIAIAIAGEYL
jgi:purine-cytosine permease-like protein